MLCVLCLLLLLLLSICHNRDPTFEYPMAPPWYLPTSNESSAFLLSYHTTETLKVPQQPKKRELSWVRLNKHKAATYK